MINATEYNRRVELQLATAKRRSRHSKVEEESSPYISLVARKMKERLVTKCLIVVISCGALLVTSASSSSHRQLRMDNLTTSTGQENATILTSIPIEETKKKGIENVTVQNDEQGDAVVELSQNASNFTIVTNSPTYAPSAHPTSMQPTYPPSAEDDDGNTTTIGNMTNWMTPVTLNSSLLIEETSIEPNKTSAEVDISNSTNDTSSFAITPSSLAPSATPQLNATMEQPETSNVNITATPDLVLAEFNIATYAPTTSTPTDAINSPTLNPSANPTPLVETAAPSSSFDTTTSVPPTSIPTIVQTLNPSANPTPLSESVASRSAPPTSTPTIAQTISSPTFNLSPEPTQQSYIPTPYLHASNSNAPIATPTYVYSPPSKEVAIDDDETNSTITDSPSQETPQTPTESPSFNPTVSTTSSEPTTGPTQDYDYDYHDDEPLHDDWPHDESEISTSPTTPTPTSPTPWPTYGPTTTEEANDAIYPRYHPTYEEEKEPTYYPTYYPTTLKKGKRVREQEKRRRKRLNPPTEAPTVVKMEFLEDVSASKTLPMVIGMILTILGIGCCAWCV
eukprot:scaffold6228_cov144-Skeletonema_dohrnii-CCMP3373.AAC.2